MAGPERALSVSDAMLLAKGALESVRVKVVGEVSEAVIKPGYKAIYFSLKDASSVMPCLMWRDAYELAGVPIVDGQLVEVTGSFTAYAAKGRLQFQVRSVAAAGEGVLRLRVAELARRLEAEGLMSPSRKRPLPAYPRAIGLVTSPRGKAVHDVIRTLARRYPVAELVIAGVQVEGDGAVAALVAGIESVADVPGVDVVIVGRGGGSYEDLMPFNAEEVARAIAACPVPVVTGIGHEPDTSIADMVADLRASTPTAAAEAVAPDRSEVTARLAGQERLLCRALAHVVKDATHRVDLLGARAVLRDPAVLLSSRLQALDLAAEALHAALPGRLAWQADALERAADALARRGPLLLERPAERVARSDERIADAAPALLERASLRLASAAARLEDLSPVAILGRGYAVCYGEGGAVVRSYADAAPGERVRVRLGDGHLGCVVEATGPEA